MNYWISRFRRKVNLALVCLAHQEQVGGVAVPEITGDFSESVVTHDCYRIDADTHVIARRHERKFIENAIDVHQRQVPRQEGF